MTKKRLSIGVLSLFVFGVLVLAVPAVVTGDHGSRYFVAGSPVGLDVARGVVGQTRHELPGGFSADLTLGQVRALEIIGGPLGVTVASVVQYHITKPPGGCDPWPECKNGGDSGGDTGRQSTPSDQTPWGIERIYNDTTVLSTAGGAGVDVAVLDTGVFKDHLDLKNRLVQCKDFSHPRGVRNGKCADKNGHGTHTAGTVLADGGSDGKGIYGVAPDANLFAYKVCGDSGLCWADDIAAAMREAASEGAEIISMSLGGDSESSLIRDAIADVAGTVLIVAAAGNDGPADGSIDYPGANAAVIAVGATDISDNVPSWSSRGVNDGDGIIEEREVEFGAPGVGVESTWNDGSYNTISGTSMSTPHTAGLAAKVWQGNAASTRSYLQGLAQDIWEAGDDTATGFGLPHL